MDDTGNEIADKKPLLHMRLDMQTSYWRATNFTSGGPCTPLAASSDSPAILNFTTKDGHVCTTKFWENYNFYRKPDFRDDSVLWINLPQLYEDNFQPKQNIQQVTLLFSIGLSQGVSQVKDTFTRAARVIMQTVHTPSGHTIEVYLSDGILFVELNIRGHAFDMFRHHNCTPLSEFNILADRGIQYLISKLGKGVSLKLWLIDVELAEPQHEEVTEDIIPNEDVVPEEKPVETTATDISHMSWYAKLRKLARNKNWLYNLTKPNKNNPTEEVRGEHATV